MENFRRAVQAVQAQRAAISPPKQEEPVIAD